MTPSVIVAGARTPIGKFAGGFKDLAAVDLGAVAIREAVSRAGVTPEQIDYVLMGQVLQAGAGQITARQAAIKAGLPKETPAITINKVCLSGLNAIALADQLNRAGDIAEAWEQGRFKDEVVPVEVPQRKGDPVVVDRDEGIRGDTTAESLGKLKPAFKKDGTITAGNASQISDGAAAVVVMSRAKADELGVAPLAEIVAHGMS